MSTDNQEKNPNEADVQPQDMSEAQQKEHTNHGTVTLTTDPWLKPLVCGICGSQYETGRGLDVHLRSHRVGNKSPGRALKVNASPGLSNTGAKRKPVRKPESKEKSSNSVIEIEDRLPGSLRRSSRAPKRTSWLQEYLVPKITGYDDDDIEEGPNKGSPSKKMVADAVTIADADKEAIFVPTQDNSTAEVVVETQPDDTETISQPPIEVIHLQPAQPETSQASDIVTGEQLEGNQLETPITSEVSPEQNQTVTPETVSADMIVKLYDEDGNPSTEAPTVDKTTSSELQHGDDSGEDPDYEDDEDDSDYEAERPPKKRQKSLQGTLVKKECTICGKFLGTSHMKRHMLAVHLNQKDYVCDREGCEKRFAVVTELKYHILAVHDKAMAKECTLCGKVLADQHSLKTHMKNKHTVKEPKPEVACEICGKVFQNIRACSSHMKQHTMARKPTTCEKCNKVFVNPSKLLFHLKVNPRCNISRHVCDLCGYKATSPWRLNNHLQQTHSLARNFECEHCHKTFKTKEMVKNHKHKVHTGTPTLKCEVCDRMFFYQAELKEHLQIHSSKRPFTCHICKQSFKTMHVLRGHLTGKHSDTWFSCGFCKFTTSHKKSMKRHMKLVHKLTNVQLEVTVEEPTPVHVQNETLYISSEDGTVQVHIPDNQVQVEELEQTITSSSGNVQVLSTAGLDGEGTHFTPSCSTVEEVSEVLVALGNMAEAAEFQAIRSSQEVNIPSGSQEIYVATQNISDHSDQQVIADSELVKSIILNANNVKTGGVNEEGQLITVSDDGVVYVSNEGLQ